MAKILICPLGAGDANQDIYKRKYRQAKYKIGDKIIETSFIASVLIDYLKVDKVIIVGTSRSMWENVYKHYAELVNDFDEEYWKNIGEKVGKSDYKNYNISENDLKKVEEVIDKYLKKINPNATGGSKCKIIRYGVNEAEIWENFDIFMGIIKEINDGDEIYLDITHSFRSIPLFMYLMLEFIKYLKKDVKLKGIYYGMLDAYTGDYAPIVDLSPLFEISNWIKGMYDFTNYGNNYLISKLLKDEDEEMSELLDKLSFCIDLNYMRVLRESIDKIKKRLKDNNEGRFLKYFIPCLSEFLSMFENCKYNYQFLLNISKWNLEHKKLSQSVFCLLESILTMLTEIYGIEEVSESKEIARMMINKRILTKDYPELKKLNDIYRKIVDIRNPTAHSDMYSEIDITNFEDRIKNLIVEVENLLNSNEMKELPTKLSLDKLFEYALEVEDIDSMRRILKAIIVIELGKIFNLTGYNLRYIEKLIRCKALTSRYSLLYELGDIYYKLNSKRIKLSKNEITDLYNRCKEILSSKDIAQITLWISMDEILSL